MKRIILSLTLLVVSAGYATSQQPQISLLTPQDQVIGRILGNATPAVRVAVPEFTVEGSTDARTTSLAQTFNKVLWDDLEYAGPIIMASRSFYPSGPIRAASDIKRQDWTRPGVEAAYIAYGSIRLNGPEFIVNAQFHDLGKDAHMFGNSYRSRNASEATARDLAHRFADAILVELGYGRGISRTEIAFVCDREGKGQKEICVMDYDGQNVNPVTAVGLALTPSWSPDNKKIAYTSFREGSSIEIINRADLIRRTFPLMNGLNMTPAWAPGGHQIAFASNSRDLRSGTRILVADEDGKNIRELTRSDRTDVSPVWNPKGGNELIFASDRSPNQEGATQLYVVDKEGSNLRLLGKPGGSTYNPAYSPDGLLVAFAWQQSGPGNHRDIWVLNLKTDSMAQLTANAGDNERPTWAPDQRHIAFASNRSGSWQIYSMLVTNPATTTRVLTKGGSNQGPAWSGHLQ